MNHIKKNGKISNGGKSDKYSLSDPPTLQESCAFLFEKHFAYRHWRMWCTRRVVKTAHLVGVTQTHMFLVVCTRDSRARHIINAHALAQEHVGCLSPRAYQKSSVRVTFRRTLLDVPNPFPSLCSTPPPAQSSLLNTGMGMNPVLLRKEVFPLAEWPNNALSHIRSVPGPPTIAG